MTGRAQRVPPRFMAVCDGYAAALDGARLDAATRRAYLSRVRSYLAWLGSAAIPGADPLADPGARDLAVREYLGYLGTARNLAARTVYDHHTALDHFYEHLDLGPPWVRRGELPRRVYRALDEREQVRWLAELQERPLARDRAIGRLLFNCGLRPPELAALDVGDVRVRDLEGTVTVRAGEPRQIPLSDPAAAADIATWQAERPGWPGASSSPALILNLRGGRLSTRSVSQLLSELATAAGLTDEHGRPDGSPHRIRLTYGANLICGGTDIITVSALMGLRNLESVRLAILPVRASGEGTAAAAGLP